MNDTDHSVSDPSRKRNEYLTFAFLGLALAPILSVVLIGGYGLLVWLLE